VAKIQVWWNELMIAAYSIFARDLLTVR